jgi:hypothetical protein
MNCKIYQANYKKLKPSMATLPASLINRVVTLYEVIIMNNVNAEETFAFLFSTNPKESWGNYASLLNPRLPRVHSFVTTRWILEHRPWSGSYLGLLR